MNTILSLKPGAIWRHFYGLTQIPRPSGYCSAVAGHIENFGRELSLEVLRDGIGNVCIRKPATAGYEGSPTVILQAHLDMVPQADDPDFDFTQKPVEAIIDGQWVRAAGTTLGADNGIGVAAIMAVLEASDLRHGPIEGLFTVDEETGMYGAEAIESGFINGKIMLNLDSELDGELYIGCAGGENISATISYSEESYVATKREEDVKMTISLSGLKGGHSGVDIHLGRANANKLLARFLREAEKTVSMRLISLAGGNMRNAIPREASATVIVCGEKACRDIEILAEEYKATLIKEFEDIEDPEKLSIDTKREKPEEILRFIPFAVKEKLINVLNSCPNGVINMFSEKIPDTVETSVNMSIVNTSDNRAEVKFLARSSSKSKKKAICSSIESAFDNAGADVYFDGNYPGWDPDYNSSVLGTMKKVFEKQRGYSPAVKVMHAGLECGIILAKIPGLDTVSFGPTIKHPHSPAEKVEIESVGKFWEFLTAVLENI
ncbi:MAG: aminoacyl-histidine dipeptidase [Dysgonamonadaceae bacterium]|jgi:dipeptidase D|nr:aminoacyl-histidine dipeptidase [Dysgonamonadaceae bacterium]